jgi:hypothetical protein
MVWFMALGETSLSFSCGANCSTAQWQVRAVKWPRNKNYHSPPSVPRLRMSGVIPSLSHTFSLCGFSLSTWTHFYVCLTGRHITHLQNVLKSHFSYITFLCTLFIDRTHLGEVIILLSIYVLDRFWLNLIWMFCLSSPPETFRLMLCNEW